jgi:hypothetical protein
MSIKLNESQLALLSGASRRKDHYLSLPHGAKLAHARRAAAKLLEAGLVREVKARKDAPVWRRDQDADQAYALKLTAAGIKAIADDDSHGVDEAAPLAPSGDTLPNEAARDAIHDATKVVGRVEPGCVAATPIVLPRMGTKIAEVIALLEGQHGATLGQLTAATGWLSHTTRAALTGLRKRGYQVTLDRSDRTHGSTYRIVSTPSLDGATETAVAAECAVAGNAGPSQSSPNDEAAGHVRQHRATPNAAKARVRKAA